MSDKRAYSIFKIYIGDVPSDGVTMPEDSAMTLIGQKIKNDSASIEKEDDSYTDIKNQEDNTTDFQILTEVGAQTFTFETWDIKSENLINTLGGSEDSNGVWKEPTTAYAGKEVCLRIITKEGKGLHAITDFPRVNMKGKLNGVLTNGEPASVMYTFTKLQPENATGVTQPALHIYNKPTAPTNGVVDDTADTFAWTNVEGFDNATDYEYSTDGGSNYSDCTVNPQTGITGAVAIGDLLVRVKAVTTGNKTVAGFTLANTTAFTV